MAKKADLAVKFQEVLAAKDIKVNKKDSEELVNGFLDAIVDLTKQNGKLSLFGFGAFEIRERAARTGRNPQTGTEIEISASKTIAFKPVKAVKDAVNN